jgi:predicted nucleic acid-binding protein
MLVLDTDHTIEYQKGTSQESKLLTSRLRVATEPYATSIVTVEESIRGWLADIKRNKAPHAQVAAYARFRQVFIYFATWEVLLWNEAAAD